MVRRRKHFTITQKREANNESARRYREKHKDELKARREEKARLEELERHERHESESNENKSDEMTGLKTSTNHGDILADLNKSAIQTFGEYTKLVPNRQLYVEQLYLHYLKNVSCEYNMNFDQANYFDQEKEKLQAHIDTLTTILRKIRLKVGWTMDGTHSQVEEMKEEIAETIIWIDDVHSYAMLGGMELQLAYEEGNLIFIKGGRVQ
ncbi:hypothetical protein E1B28_013083 [Marasmius oreades]|uniref:BZIP domain-containing protein n=1 Tax=Marasmius oreades TaxID=181124 RepID=A0A9P7RP57_9AGAR|nr:uncharacterized protein E1B28_013083 [Marasmius oreades]KAG7087102.1 hypothetical protein E1B28_013083 [Marasmius oreades]